MTSHPPSDFIDAGALNALLDGRPDPGRTREILAKSLDLHALSVEETAQLILADDPDSVDAVFESARELKRRVYGNRIVLFAPLYIGNECVNDCQYCAFRRSNPGMHRRTLSEEETREQILALERMGHKRLILVFGEHPDYAPEFIAQVVRHAYKVREGHGEIRRININAAPLSVEGFRTVKASQIGTYQIFQETYHRPTYERVHPADTNKGDFVWRLTAQDRAMEGGIDDVGIGALFGLADWRFEVLALVRHALHLQEAFNVGPHTISFPRLCPAHDTPIPTAHLVNDRDFKRLIAILRLAVPYTGLILTAREKPEIRREVLSFGVSQIDAGSRIELGGYTEVGDAQVMEREQFSLGDIRPLDDVIRELIETGYIPSFCTSCYRIGRTGEHFMEFAVPGFIKRFCTPNALLTLMEYLVDYAAPGTKAAGEKVLEEELARLPDSPTKNRLKERLNLIRTTDRRDMYF